MWGARRRCGGLVTPLTAVPLGWTKVIYGALWSLSGGSGCFPANPYTALFNVRATPSALPLLTASTVPDLVSLVPLYGATWCVPCAVGVSTDLSGGVHMAAQHVPVNKEIQRNHALGRRNLVWLQVVQRLAGQTGTILRQSFFG